MVDQDSADSQFNVTTARLLRREALRRAAKELSTMTGPGLENALARISSEVTEEAAQRRANVSGKGHDAGSSPGKKLPGRA
jgi:phage shock protein A